MKLVVAAALVVAAVAGAGEARGDAGGYLRKLDSMGIPIDTNADAVKYLDIGNSLCELLTVTGNTPFAVAEDIHLRANVPMEYASTLVISAVLELCPKFSGRLHERGSPREAAPEGGLTYT